MPSERGQHEQGTGDAGARRDRRRRRAPALGPSPAGAAGAVGRAPPARGGRRCVPGGWPHRGAGRRGTRFPLRSPASCGQSAAMVAVAARFPFGGIRSRTGLDRARPPRTLCDIRHTRALPSGERIHSRAPAGPKPAPPPVETNGEEAAVRAHEWPGPGPEAHTASLRRRLRHEAACAALCRPSTLTGGLTELAWVGAHVLMYPLRHADRDAAARRRATGPASSPPPSGRCSPPTPWPHASPCCSCTAWWTTARCSP